MNEFIESITLIKGRTTEDREMEIRTKEGDVIHVSPCYESWSQYGADEETLWKTVEYCDMFNDWLHGGLEPDGVDFMVYTTQLY